MYKKGKRCRVSVAQGVVTEGKPGAGRQAIIDNAEHDFSYQTIRDPHFPLMASQSLEAIEAKSRTRSVTMTRLYLPSRANLT